MAQPVGGLQVRTTPWIVYNIFLIYLIIYETQHQPRLNGSATHFNVSIISEEIINTLANFKHDLDFTLFDVFFVLVKTLRNIYLFI